MAAVALIRRLTLRTLKVLLPASLGGCELVSAGVKVCTAEFRYGLAVYVKDANTGAWAASGARLLTTDMQGTPVDTVNAWPSAAPAGKHEWDAVRLLGAGERAGVYRVFVRKPGFADWVRVGVRVSEDDCHVRTVNLLAQLRPMP